jgi:deoxyribodipyrimidine photolyase-related protein
MHISVIFPNQLFELKYIPYDIAKIDYFIIVEDPLYFSDMKRKLRFNLLKLIYQRASMKYYQSYLKENDLKVIYLDWNANADYLYEYIYDKFGTNNQLYFIDPVDKLLEKRIIKFTKVYQQEYDIFETASFLCTEEDLDEYIDTKSSKTKFYQYNFYIWQRHRLNILIDNTTQKPIGSKYSFDKENRKAIPGKDFDIFLKDNKIKYPPESYDNKFYTPAISYCESTFTNYYKKNYVPENIYNYPITHADTNTHIKLFIKYKLEYFGAYQDAIDKDHISLFHSVISPQLNNGLITPNQILNYVIKYYNKSNSKTKKTVLSAVEGYIRQLNWREYSRLLYVKGPDLTQMNYFKNQRHLNKKWYDGETKILPVDLAIKQAFQFGYLHHIQRLMVVSNFMNLCAIDPSDAYKWFMEFSLDSYDWVMCNNVYGMAMFADGGLTTTKVYISTGSYIKAQSNIPIDGVWDVIWKILYYLFIYRNYNKLTGRSTIYKHQWDAYKNKNMIKKEGRKLILKLTTG